MVLKHTGFIGSREMEYEKYDSEGWQGIQQYCPILLDPFGWSE
jgi:hypothetical protein